MLLAVMLEVKLSSTEALAQRCGSGSETLRPARATAIYRLSSSGLGHTHTHTLMRCNCHPLGGVR